MLKDEILVIEQYLARQRNHLQHTTLALTGLDGRTVGLTWSDQSAGRIKTEHLYILSWQYF